MDKNPILAAQYQCDKHVSKMVVESGQMLSTAHRVIDNIDEFHPLNDILYRSTHANHPSVLWTMSSGGNYDWHYNHFVALCDEYTHRYKKKHLTDTKLRDTLKNMPANITDSELEDFILGMKLESDEIVENDIVQTYRNYYINKQDRFNMKWTNRDIPEWFSVKEDDMNRFFDF